MRILVTGAAGAMGSVICPGLAARGHAVIGFDRTPRLVDGCERMAAGELVDAVAIDRAMAGIDAVLHLAATPDRADFVTDLVPNNLVGTHHVLEAAHRHGCARVVLASTIRVAGAYDGPRPVRVDAPCRPVDGYALSKVCGEAMGEMCSRTTGLTVLAARFGWFVRNPEEAAALARYEHGPRVYLGHADAVRFAVRAVEAPLSGFAALFVTSRPCGEPLVDLEPAARLIGWEPLERWPDGLPWPVPGVAPPEAGT